MYALVRNASMPIATVLGVTLCAPWAVSVLAAPAQLNDATQSQVAPVLHSGDLVRLRSGGPLMTVITVRNDQVICSWSGQDAEPRSGSFQIGLVTAPVTIPPDDPHCKKTNGPLINTSGSTARREYSFLANLSAHTNLRQ
jgi:uncharacterized protein YodC (DUF2158 family)